LAPIIADELAIIFADVAIDRRRFTLIVVVVAGGDDEVGVPRRHQVGNARLVLAVEPEVADDGELDARVERRAIGPSVRFGQPSPRAPLCRRVLPPSARKPDAHGTYRLLGHLDEVTGVEATGDAGPCDEGHDGGTE
jgi:hypothetical protein